MGEHGTTGSDAAVLTFRGVTAAADRDHDIGLTNVSCTVGAGEMMLVLAEAAHPRLPFADLAEGLLAPESGTVEFLGKDWTTLTPDQAVKARARIGRVFAGTAWVSNLDTDENVLLRERHHSRRPTSVLEAEALAWAQKFGLDDLPRQRPAWVRRSEFMRTQWVRSVLGKPRLLLLEYPETDVTREELQTWQNALQQVRADGTAIVWFTLDEGLWKDAVMQPACRWRMRGPELLPEEETNR